MRANHPARALLRGAMAAVLACGLMMPAGAIAAEAQGTEPYAAPKGIAR